MANQTPGTISAEKLCSLTGLTDRRHRQLAAEGFFPPPIRGEYQASATIAGMFRYFRTSKQTTSSRERFEAARASREERKDDLEARLVIPAQLVGRIWGGVVLELRQKILNLNIPQEQKEEILSDLQDIPIEEYFTDSTPVSEDAAEDDAGAS